MMDEYVVTTLDDRGAGSLREAVQASGPRRVTFDVAGYISLKSALRIDNPYLTIDGSTAPSRGVCIRHNEVYIRTHDVVISYMRFRLGEDHTVGHDSGACLIVLLTKNASTDERYPRRILIDHCSFSWSQDTAVDLWNGRWNKRGNNAGVPQIRDVTISNCFVTEPLGSGRLHGTGLLIGAGAEGTIIDHCLFAHSRARNPSIVGGRHSVINCAWDDVVAGCTAGESPEETGVPPALINVAGCAARRISNRIVLLNPSRKEENVEQQKSHRVFVDNNVGRVVQDITQDPWGEVGWGWGMKRGPADRSFQASEMIKVPGLPDVDFPDQALASILAHGGCSLPVRDDIDERIVRDVIDGTGHIIDSPSEVGGYPPLDDIEEPPTLPPELPDMPALGTVTIELNGTIYQGIVMRQD
jgi:hypothetical protein